jgi:hypothetical protein
MLLFLLFSASKLFSADSIAVVSSIEVNQTIVMETLNKIVESYVHETGNTSYGEALSLALPFGKNCQDQQLRAFIDGLGFQELVICDIDGRIKSSVEVHGSPCQLPETKDLNVISQVELWKTDYMVLPFNDRGELYGYLLLKKRKHLALDDNQLPAPSILDSLESQFSVVRELVGLRGMIGLGIFGLIIAIFMFAGALNTLSYGISQ